MTQYSQNSAQFEKLPAPLRRSSNGGTIAGSRLDPMFQRSATVFGVAVLLAAAVAACSSDSPHATTDELRKRGVAKVGYANESPYAYVANDTGKLTGEAPEIARAVLHQMGVPEVEGVLTEFGSLVPGLKAGRFDFVAAGMYVTPARCKEVAFSEPTYCIGQAFAVKAGNPQGLHSYRDVAKSERARLGVVRGTVEQGYAEKLGVPAARIVIFPDAPSALAGVQAGRVDAFAGTSLTINDLLKKAGDGALMRATPFRDPVIDGKPARGCGAFAFRRRDTALLAAFNQKLTAFIGSDAHVAIMQSFGFTRDDLPTGVTTAALCAAQ